MAQRTRDRRRLTVAVATRTQVRSLDATDRGLLAAWLSQPEQPPSRSSSLARRRRRLLIVASAAALGMVPWVMFLAVSLPNRQNTHGWRVAWVGFDIGLIAVFAALTWLAWRDRQLVLPVLTIAATLLLCDAWFDLALSWGTSDQWTSLITAVLVEVPFAMFLIGVHHRLLRAITVRLWHESGHAGDPPPLWRHLIVRAQED